ncbi:MAG: hypothetical protein ACLR8Y_09785 [Alistipes indistinctus]
MHTTAWAKLQSADYKPLSGGVWNPSANYQEGGLTYDLNGNILSVQRTDGNGENLHELTYTYDGYRLLSVGVNGTASDSYLYDADGNMTFDGRRGLTIAYNTLNLPEEIVAENQKINYIYSASGEKLACDANGSLTYYRSVMVYGGDNKLLYMLTPGGNGVLQRGFRRNELHVQLLQDRPSGQYARDALGRRWDAASLANHRFLSLRPRVRVQQPEQEQISVLREGVAGRKPRRFDARMV